MAENNFLFKLNKLFLAKNVTQKKSFSEIEKLSIIYIIIPLKNYLLIQLNSYSKGAIIDLSATLLKRSGNFIK